MTKEDSNHWWSNLKFWCVLNAATQFRQDDSLFVQSPVWKQRSCKDKRETDDVKTIVDVHAHIGHVDMSLPWKTGMVPKTHWANDSTGFVGADQGRSDMGGSDAQIDRKVHINMAVAVPVKFSFRECWWTIHLGLSAKVGYVRWLWRCKIELLVNHPCFFAGQVILSAFATRSICMRHTSREVCSFCFNMSSSTRKGRVCRVCIYIECRVWSNPSYKNGARPFKTQDSTPN